MSNKRIAFCGHSGAGKDTACLFLARTTGLRFAGSTSYFLAPYVAEEIGVPVEVLRGPGRHRYAEQMFVIGNRLREGDPGYLVRDSLAEADLVCGFRDPREIDYAREHDLIDLFVWIDRDVPKDPTMRLYGADKCDIRIDNYAGLEAFEARLTRLARFAGIPPCTGPVPAC